MSDCDTVILITEVHSIFRRFGVEHNLGETALSAASHPGSQQNCPSTTHISPQPPTAKYNLSNTMILKDTPDIIPHFSMFSSFRLKKIVIENSFVN